MKVVPAVRNALGLALAGTTLLASGGCRVGTDLPVEEPGDLEQAEAEAIVETLVLTSLENTVFSQEQVLFYHAHGPQGAHTHPITGPFTHDFEFESGPLPSSHNLFNVDFAEQVPCGGGGATLLEAAAVGEGNPLMQRGFVDYQLGHSMEECVVVVTNSGDELLLSNPPYVTGEASVRYDGGSLGEITGFLTGGIGWEGESKAGECDLTLDFMATGPTVLEIVDIPVTGTVCDFEIDVIVSRF